VSSEDYRKHCCSRPNTFIGVWEGRATTRRSSHQQQEPSNAILTYLTTISLYKQHHRRSCVLSAFASAFQQAGRSHVVQHICSHIKSSLKYDGSRVKFATDLVRSRDFRFVCKGKRGASFDDIEYNNEFPVVLQLQASDNAVDHCVCVCKGILFYSSFQHPVSFTREGLKMCCSGEDMV
jgi:hypothetical protein